MRPPVEDAEEHLRTIRTLMERAVVYRAVSGPAALAAGILTLAVCAVLGTGSPLSAEMFTGVWLSVLAAVSLLNFSLLARSARRREEPFVSSGMKLALRAVAPPLLAGFVLSQLTLSQRPGAFAEITAAWILFYGLALLSMGSFAPKSLLALGGGFFTAGLLAYLFCAGVPDVEQFAAALKCMALTFGLLHLIYAAAALVLQKRAALETSAVSSAGE